MNKNTDYHRDTSAVSKSGLDLINQSPFDYWNKYLNPDNPWTDESTPTLLMGSALHCLVFENDEFLKRFLVAPKIDRRTKEGKIAAEELDQQRSAMNLELLPEDMYNTVVTMYDSIYRHPIAAKLLNQKGVAEYRIDWTDPDTGVKCKLKADKITDSKWFFDLKSSASIHPDDFIRSVVKYRYHVQDAFYTDGFQHAIGEQPEGFAFICVRNTEPHIVKVYTLDAAAIQLGRDIYKSDLRVYAECLRTGVWPGYTGDAGDVSELSLPSWAFNKQILI